LVEQAKLERVFSSPFFNEFVVRGTELPRLFDRCATQKIVPGIELATWYPELPDSFLLCVTEMNEREEIDRLVRTIAG
jgi:glycine dehydrogenase subunit 1